MCLTFLTTISLIRSTILKIWNMTTFIPKWLLLSDWFLSTSMSSMWRHCYNRDHICIFLNCIVEVTILFVMIPHLILVQLSKTLNDLTKLHQNRKIVGPLYSHGQPKPTYFGSKHVGFGCPQLYTMLSHWRKIIETLFSTVHLISHRTSLLVHETLTQQCM